MAPAEAERVVHVIADPYLLLRPLLFSVDAESSHDLVLGALAGISRSRLLVSLLSRIYGPVTGSPVSLMGLEFANPVGLAAGLDKDARAVNALAALGFGWLELGTVTPRPQPGNTRPRMFRISDSEAIINRMGFNSGGLDRFVENLNRHSSPVPLGINIGKNADTPLELAADDYVAGMQAVYSRADYVCVNISSPNTANLRRLQGGENLDSLVSALLETRRRLENETGLYRPITIKIAPDMDDRACAGFAEIVRDSGIDGIIATNTTIERPLPVNAKHRDETGGLSGRPLLSDSTRVLKAVVRELRQRLPVIAVGGIMCAQDARRKMDAGASAVQIYTGLIYRGPALVREIAQSLR